MPYIPAASRPILDVIIGQLADEIKAMAKEYDSDGGYGYAGLLNYSMTKLAIETLPTRRYWTCALTSGVIHNVYTEFYRRFVVPYEDEQIEKNGDVYP
jgi:hypothetical protein